jgi:NTP pyrophosphatase (non-canonical NTP hydrolase)
MKLPDKHLETLLICQEECAEVTQAISKVMRFGLDSRWNDRTNQERLEEEIGDLMAMVEILEELRIVDPEFIRRAAIAKRHKLLKWSNIFTEETS